jgi:membrane protease YdiL (CAAX protease family)
LPIIGIDGFIGKTIPSDTKMPLLFMAMCTGPIIASLLSIYLTEGKKGLKKIVFKLVKWKIKFKFYIIALFTAPLLIAISHFILSLFSPKFIPVIYSSDDKIIEIIGGITGGLVAGFFEELGWTGFAIPKLRLKYSIISTGFIVGVIWGIWHFPLFMNKDPSGVVPLLVLLMAKLITHLPAFRILMTWVYDCTQSLLIVILMHMSLTASALTLQSEIINGLDIIILNLVIAFLLYIIIIIVNILTKGQIIVRKEKEKLQNT